MTMPEDFADGDLIAIDVEYRASNSARCPHDEKPLVATSWKNGAQRMVYFLCRECTRVGAIAYDSDDPNVPGKPARRITSLPPSAG